MIIIIYQLEPRCFMRVTEVPCLLNNAIIPPVAFSHTKRTLYICIVKLIEPHQQHMLTSCLLGPFELRLESIYHFAHWKKMYLCKYISWLFVLWLFDFMCSQFYQSLKVLFQTSLVRDLIFTLLNDACWYEVSCSYFWNNKSCWVAQW